MTAAARALVALGVAVALSTELLGALHLLTPWPIAVLWTTFVLLWGRLQDRLTRKRCRGAGSQPAAASKAASAEPPSGAETTSWFDTLLLAALATIFTAILVTAVACAPNSADAMAYHLPRVLYWAQARSVSFFPTPYYNQLMLPPLAEYFMLHTWLLTGGDRLANLVQLLGMLGSVLGVALIARALGANRRGQILAAVVCATLPNGILQASGAKNDYLLACWLVLMAAFALRREYLWMAAALALAAFTKPTAYLFAPPLLAATVAVRYWPRAAGLCAAAILVINGPLYWRNLRLSGSPIGFDSAHGDGRFRWRNESPGPAALASNALRNLSDQLGARSPAWNHGVHQTVLEAHRLLGLDPNDPNTTWPGETYAPPRNANHEANANNRRQLVLFLALLPLTMRRHPWALYAAAIPAGFLLFSAFLKWQPFMARLELPLFVLMSPLAALIKPPLLQAALALLLFDSARLPLLENWTRPLEGPRSVLATSPAEEYFNDMVQWNNRDSYLRAAELTLATGCRDIGIDITRNELEYPYIALLRAHDRGFRFRHTGIPTATGFQPCAVLCLDCAARPDRLARYRHLGEPVQFGHFLLFVRNAPPAR